MKKAIQKGTHAKLGSAKAKAAEKKKPKTKPKFNQKKAAADVVTKAMKSLKQNPLYNPSGYELNLFGTKRQPKLKRTEVKPGIFNTKITKNYGFWAGNFRKSYNNNWLNNFMNS